MLPPSFLFARSGLSLRFFPLRVHAYTRRCVKCIAKVMFSLQLFCCRVDAYSQEMYAQMAERARMWQVGRSWDGLVMTAASSCVPQLVPE